MVRVAAGARRARALRCLGRPLDVLPDGLLRSFRLAQPAALRLRTRYPALLFKGELMKRPEACHFAPAVIAGIVALCLLCGCAPKGGATPPTARPGLPGWVRVVPRTEGGKAFYVGGCSAATSVEAGITLAEGDALSQIENEARAHFREIIMTAGRGSDIEVSSTDRAMLWGRGGDLLSESLIESATREQVHYEECGGAGTGAVCQIFVLLTVDLEHWDASVLRGLEQIGARAREEKKPGASQLAEFAARFYQRKAPAQP